jgi:sulfoxide reductase heme-binding subunit YedZ
VHLVAASSTTWYMARAGGVVAYLLVSACVLAGIVLAGKQKVPGLPRFAVEDVHRFLGLLAGLFIAVHVGSVALDSVVPFSLSQLVVPFTAGYRPLATGLGIIALELLLAVSITNRLRSRLPYRVWRRAHYATIAVWLLATTHGVLAGTDRDQTWLVWLYSLTVATIVAAAMLRFGRAPLARRVTTGLVAGCVALAAVVGLASLPQAAPATKKHTAAVPELAGPLTGTIRSDDGSGIVSITGRVASTSAFRIDLLTGSGRVADNALTVRFAGGTTCEGQVTSLDDRGFAGTCTLPGGAVRTIKADWTVANGTVSGTVSSTAGTSSA